MSVFLASLFDRVPIQRLSSSLCEALETISFGGFTCKVNRQLHAPTQPRVERHPQSRISSEQQLTKLSLSP